MYFAYEVAPKQFFLIRACADPEGGRGPDPPPPPQICQRWSLVWIFDGYERGSKGCFYSFFFWLAPLASIPNFVNI